MDKIKVKKFLDQMKNLNHPSGYIVFAVVLFLSYAGLNYFLRPKPVRIDFIETALKENKKVFFYLKEYTTYSREFFVDIGSDSYSHSLYLRDLDDTTKLLDSYKVKLPKQELTFFEIVNKNKYLDAFWYLCVGMFFFALYKTYVYASLKSKNILLETPNIKFKDVAGIDNVLVDVKSAVKHFLNNEKLTAMGGKPIKGLIFHGPPGTGKTLMAKAIAGETKANFIAISGSQLVELYVGMGAKRVREMFDSARSNAPCVLFIDEIDAFALKRGSNRSHSEYDQTVAEMLTQLDGFKDNSGVLVIAATNNLGTIDDALLRPGRFDRKIKVDLPTLDGRKEILSLYISKNEKMKDINIEQLAKQTTGFSGADLKNLVDQSITEAIEKDSLDVTMKHFFEAKNKIQMGNHSNIKLNEEEKKITAYHEVGHALISKLINGPTVAQVSILPRGQSLGQTLFDVEEKYSHTKIDIENQIKICLGGRIAERMITNTESTGASDDLKKATSLARALVCSFGMSQFGSISVEYGSNEYHMLSESTKSELDKETFALLNQIEKDVTWLLNSNKEKIELIVEKLIKEETLMSNEFYEI